MAFLTLSAGKHVKDCIVSKPEPKQLGYDLKIALITDVVLSILAVAVGAMIVLQTTGMIQLGQLAFIGSIGTGGGIVMSSAAGGLLVTDLLTLFVEHTLDNPAKPHKIKKTLTHSTPSPVPHTPRKRHSNQISRPLTPPPAPAFPSTPSHRSTTSAAVPLPPRAPTPPPAPTPPSSSAPKPSGPARSDLLGKLGSVQLKKADERPLPSKPTRTAPKNDGEIFAELKEVLEQRGKKDQHHPSTKPEEMPSRRVSIACTRDAPPAQSTSSLPRAFSQVAEKIQQYNSSETEEEEKDNSEWDIGSTDSIEPAIDLEPPVSTTSTPPKNSSLAVGKSGTPVATSSFGRKIQDNRRSLHSVRDIIPQLSSKNETYFSKALRTPTSRSKLNQNIESFYSHLKQQLKDTSPFTSYFKTLDEDDEYDFDNKLQSYFEELEKWITQAPPTQQKECIAEVRSSLKNGIMKLASEHTETARRESISRRKSFSLLSAKTIQIGKEENEGLQRSKLLELMSMRQSKQVYSLRNLVSFSELSMIKKHQAYMMIPSLNEKGTVTEAFKYLDQLREDVVREADRILKSDLSKKQDFKKLEAITQLLKSEIESLLKHFAHSDLFKE